MKDLHQLLEYIDCYRYSRRTETIHIAETQDSNEARHLYESILDKYNFSNEEKWHFDVALDAVRTMGKRTREYIVKNLFFRRFTVKDHFGTGLSIRNKYVHCSKFHDNYFADSASSSIREMVYSILHPIYNGLNSRFVWFIKDEVFSNLYTEYYIRFPEVFDHRLQDIADSAEEDLNTEKELEKIRDDLRRAAGDEFFRNAFHGIVDSLSNDQDEIFGRLADRDTVKMFLSSYRLLYSQECDQIIELVPGDVLTGIQTGKIQSEAECRKTVAGILGKDEDSVSFITSCIWQSCYPIVSGNIAERSCCWLNTESFASYILCENHINTIGELTEKRSDEILELKALIFRGKIKTVSMKSRDIIKIKRQLKEYGLFLRD